MDRKEMTEKIKALYESCCGNVLTEAEAVGVKLFDAPLIGIGSAEDALFSQFKAPEIIGPWFMTPSEWLKNGKTVISLFFPFTEEVKKSNRVLKDTPSMLWLYGRIEGQAYLAEYGRQLEKWFTEQGMDACVPAIDARFQEISAGNVFSEYTCVNKKTFGSNWSERHAAYVCGLGTFGLSKGLITERGMAGRLLSIIISGELEADQRAYMGIYDYCTQCGACIRRCPVNAISFEKGKDHTVCSTWLKKTGQMYAPRFGCGLCQTGVPCESRNPSKRTE